MIVKKSLFILLIIMLTSCQSINSGSIDQINPPSIKDIISSMSKEARYLDQNARLDLVVINVIPDPKKEKYQIMTSHDYDLTDDRRIYVFYYPDGRIESREIHENLLATSSHSDGKFLEGISMSEDLIDSTEAWAIFLKSSEISKYSYGDFRCSFMILKKGFYQGDEMVIWRITVNDCQNDDLEVIDIHAYTGEFLGKK